MSFDFNILFTPFSKFLISLFVIANPVGIIPVFLGLTESQTVSEKMKTARITSFSFCCILLFSVWFGEPFLQFFGISLPAFQVAAGITIFLMAIAMLHAHPSAIKHTQEEKDTAVDQESVAVVPLAIPMLAGPGAISTVILATHHTPGILFRFLMCFGIVGLGLLLWLVLKISNPIGKKLGLTGINISTRIMGLILAALSIEFIAKGIKGLF